jgi:N-acetylneuraminic acid mutarotase
MMPSPRDHFAAVESGGLIYAIGGEYGHDVHHAHSRLVHSFDPTTGEWKRLADLPRARSHMEAGTFAYDGRIYVAGGQFGEFQPAGSVFEYDVAANDWDSVKSLPQPRQGGAIQKIGGKLVIALGALQTDEPQTDVWVGDFRAV